MQFIGLVLAFIGSYFVDSAIQNRPPIRTIEALIDDPSDLTGTLERLNGTWQGETAIVDTSTIADPAAQAKQDVYKHGNNGKLPSSELQSLSWAPSQKLRPAAANALENLNRAYKARFGRNISVTDSYRTLAEQVAVKAAKGSLAATPGTSNHGWGLAVDLGGGINKFGTVEHEWMTANAPKFGWIHPAWARQGGSKPEPWHWEFGS